MTLLFLILTFILLIVSTILFVFFFFKYKTLPDASQLPPNPNGVVCNEDDILEAWIRGYGNRESCPAFTNNYVIGDDYNMYEKYFLVDENNGCCWYSNEVNQRKLFPNPWICNGSDHVFTLNELNAKPYQYNGVQTVYTNPSCDDDPNCIAMIRAGLDTAGNGVYKLTKFRTESTETYNPEPGQAVPPPDSSAEYARRLNFYIGDSCATLNKITLDGQTLMLRQGNVYIWYDNNPAGRPAIIEDTFEIFLRDRFYPIAGANPTLSISAANYL